MLRELKTFLAVARHGSFAAAGLHVGLTPSAVSAQIRVLEQNLGVSLFDRNGRSALLNAAGRRALPLAEEILATYGRMAGVGAGEEIQGELRIGAIASVQTGLLPGTLVRLRQRAPRLEPRLVPGVSLSLLSQVDAGELDLAILIRPPFELPKELDATALLQEPFVLIAPPDLEGDDPLLLLETQPFIRYDRHSFGGRRVSAFLREQRLTVRQVLELDELDAIVKMVERGLGVALVPCAGLWLEHPRVRRLSLGALTFHRELQIITRHASRNLPPVALFRRCLTEAVSEHLHQQPVE
ncbi:LysR family transcriptional regulator [Pseudomonas oryzihabitans]|uniref:DNA-binding transcriptional LysR family regulator n=1 Tax=Pseudomonas oryzihabitans TaxID=47885 RepID=A0AAJ2BNQ2_9PSED|nr:LysR family transcriptional regulator [Pseudomonas psychrotolerans]MDR6233407.1 DNA-binding transcriptional LysR family regulator [Pseudomonas psychrotolerans]